MKYNLLILTFFLTILAPLMGQAQEKKPSKVINYTGQTKTYEIGGVTVSGLRYIGQTNVLISNSGLIVGESIDIPGVDVSVATIGKKSTDHWKSQQLNIIIDGEEHLIALLDDELKKIKQATWSRNVYMSCILHAGRLREQTVVKILNKLNSSGFESEVKNILSKEKFFFNSDIPGFNKLFKS